MPRDFGPEARAERARALVVLVGVIVVALLGRLSWLQLARGAYFRTLSEENRIDREILRAERGRIFDRNGEVLADNYPTYRLSLDPHDPAFRSDLGRLKEVVQVVAEILGRDPSELEADVMRARRRSNRPLPLSRSLEFEQVARLEERLTRLPGVAVETESSRRYPGGSFACHLLGYLGEVSEEDLEAGGETYHPGDLVGQAGIEKEYEEALRGRDGVAYVEVDAYGRRTHYFPELPALPAAPGSDLVLSIDARVQRAAEAALEASKRHVERQRALFEAWDGDTLACPAAAVVAIEPSSGEVLALASRPTFDPNIFLKGLTREEWARLNDPRHPALLDRAIQASYPPGSTFKCVTTLVGLEAGVVTAGKVFSSCGGGYFYGNRTFGCWRKGGHGTLSLLDALARSCDVYYYQVGIALGIDRLGRGAERLRVGEKTGIDLPQERAGLVPTPEWYTQRYGKGGVHRGAALNVAIGQGEVLLTPIALARFVAAVANGGRVVRPHLLLRVQDPDGTVRRDATEEDWDVGRLPVRDEHLDLLRAAMEKVVMEAGGTGGRSRIGEIRIGGKTGTAQNPHGEDHALFIAFAPVDDPRIAVAVVVEESGHGGSIAAPVARQVMAAWLQPGAESDQAAAAATFELEGD